MSAHGGAFHREIHLDSGKCVKIKQLYIGDVGCVVWDAALVLSKYLELLDIGGKTVLELGSGTGAVGIVAAAQGADVTITDLKEFVPLMNENIEINRHLFDDGSIFATKLKWGEESVEGEFDLVLLADCVYYPESLQPLVDTVNSLSQPNTTEVLCCYEKRSTGNKAELESHFLQLMGISFDITEVPFEDLHPEFRCPEIVVLKMKVKTPPG